MQHAITTEWAGKMEFHSRVNGHTIILDGPPKAGGEDHGPIPKPLLLTALTGCTGMDVVALLRKQGKQVDHFELGAEGELTQRIPLEYSAIHLTYDFRGAPECAEAALEAVTQSQEKYCGVSSMLKKIIPVTWDVVYNGQRLFTNRPVPAARAA